MEGGSIYRNVSLDQVLLPERDSPLMPTQFVQNAGVGALNIISTGGPITMPAVVSPNGSTSVTVLHGQGTSPFMLPFFRFSSNGTRRPLPYTEFQSSVEASPGAAKWKIDYEFVTVSGNPSVTFNQVYISGTYPTGTYYIEWYVVKEILR